MKINLHDNIVITINMFTFYLVITCLSFLVMLVAFMCQTAGIIFSLVGFVFILLWSSGVLTTLGTLHVLTNAGPITIVALFVITQALLETGVISQIKLLVIRVAHRHKRLGIGLAFGVVFVLSAFLNNTPIVFIMAPVMVSLAREEGYHGAYFLLPLSYVAILGGVTTLIGSSTNIIANDVAVQAGWAGFHLFSLTIPALIMALIGCLYLGTIGKYFLPQEHRANNQLLQAAPFYYFHWQKALITGVILILVVGLAALQVASIMYLAVCGMFAVLLLRCVSLKSAIQCIHWDLIALIFGMIAVSYGFNTLGLIKLFAMGIATPFIQAHPVVLFAIIFAISSLLTEFLTNNAVAIFISLFAVDLARQIGIDPTPFVAAVIFGASASFATPVGYQTNTYIKSLAGYGYKEFIIAGLPMNLLMGFAATGIAYFYWF